MQRKVVVGLLALATLFAGFLYLMGWTAAAADRPRILAMAGMVAGLLVVWIWIGGGLMHRYRRGISAWVQAIPLKWQVKFVLFATLLACLEEAVTVTMTNLAPLFGAPIGAAFITASTNYLDVIAFHSVVVFIPFFIVLALLLTRWEISPFAVFLSFGVVGTAAEAVFAGSPGALIGFPLWVFVYGLMVWLPACAVPANRGARVAGKWVLSGLPVLTLGLALPMIAPIVYVIAVVLGHPTIDFAS
jgi:hypothetical protein